MDEKDWLILKLLSKKKSINQTAKEMGLSQPALSSRLQQIEARYEASIVVRSKNGIQFTPQGEYLVQCANELLRRFQKIEENIMNMDDEVRGTIHIGASPFFSKFLLPALLKKFKEQYKAVEFKVITSSSSEIVRHAYDNDLHIAFVRGEYNWSQEKAMLFSEKIFVCSMNPFSLENLPNLPQIDYPNTHSTTVAQNRWWRENFSEQPYIGMQVDNPDTGFQMVLKGLGYGFFPTLLVNKCADLHKYEMTYKSGESLIRNTWVFYTKESSQLRSVKAFLKFVKTFDFYSI